MDGDIPSSPCPLPGSVYLETTDAERARREMSKILAPHAMTPTGTTQNFHVRHHHARLAGMSVNFIQYRPGALIGADLSRRFFLLHYVLSGRCRIGGPSDGVRLRSGDIAVINPTEPFTVKTSDDCGQIVIKLQSELMADVAFRRFGIGRDTPLRFGRSAAPVGGDTLRAVIDLVCREADRAGEPGSGNGGGTGGVRTEQMLAELLAVTLIETVPHNAVMKSAGGRIANGVAPWYVRRVEEYIELHADRPLRIEDMAAVAGVSERTLYGGFRTWRGLSPKAYLKAIRLDRARTELLGVDARALSVADIARSCGFRHLGNFARDYRVRFGERPSETRRFRLADDR